MVRRDLQIKFPIELKRRTKLRRGMSSPNFNSINIAMPEVAIFYIPWLSGNKLNGIGPEALVEYDTGYSMSARKRNDSWNESTAVEVMKEMYAYCEVLITYLLYKSKRYQ
jgi:hypothetical protein